MGNANSGRKPKPTALKLLSGVTRRDRLNDAEPKSPVGPVEKHPQLSAGASVVWDRVAPICLVMGTLTVGDVEAFKTLCELQAALDMISRQKDAEGFAPFTVSSDYDGADKVGVHAAITLELKYAPVIRPYYDYFGLNPTGRARIQVPKKAEEPVSKWAGLK